MSFFVTGQPLTSFGKLTDNADTTLYTADKRSTIVSMSFTETNGGTQTLAVWRRNKADTTSHYLRSALAVTARQHILIDEVVTLNPGDSIHAQSGDASGYFDAFLTYLAPDAQA